MNNAAITPVYTDEEKKHTKILLVEDEPDARIIFVSLLQMHTPFEIIEAADGIEALDVMEKDHEIHLVLLDIIMPKIGGIEVLKMVKEDPQKYGTPKVVMLTNLTSTDSKNKSDEYHADGYLTKINLEPVELIKEIMKYL